MNRSGSLNSFNDKTLFDPKIRNLMNKIEVSVDPEIDGLYPHQWGAELNIEMINGKQISNKTNFPKGDPENPFAAQEFIQKFNDLTKDLGDFDSLIETIYSIENLQTIDRYSNTLKSKRSKSKH
ncbi:MmgE/PrpD family protein [Psychrobacillus sp. OK032]|uniref:MmgE/PrpD family protein n=1 Tax=Psychrobacillus sp. OK032 TaxID=1884358 RepID=UPI0008BBCF3A|nr:MmgE/PrpD family protein [Psychrobacillus sp. OK032]SES46554.1 MmgE/PrpD family protein [Psychrobacillus sp. OK032]